MKLNEILLLEAAERWVSEEELITSSRANKLCLLFDPAFITPHAAILTDIPSTLTDAQAKTIVSQAISGDYAYMVDTVCSQLLMVVDQHDPIGSLMGLLNKRKDVREELGVVQFRVSFLPFMSWADITRRNIIAEDIGAGDDFEDDQ